MNLLLIRPEELSGNRAVLGGRRAEHVQTHLKKALGDRLQVGVLGRSIGTATLVEQGAGTIAVELLDQAPCRQSTTHLILAVPRPKALSRLVQHAASFGIARLTLVKTARVEPSYLTSKRLLAERLQRDLLLGLEQGGWACLPQCETKGDLSELSRELSNPCSVQARVVLHPTAERRMHDVTPEAEAAWTLAIGPDGGFIPRELELLSGLGFQQITLGPGVLRTEAAVCAALGQLELCRTLGRVSGPPALCRPARP